MIPSNHLIFFTFHIYTAVTLTLHWVLIPLRLLAMIFLRFFQRTLLAFLWTLLKLFWYFLDGGDWTQYLVSTRPVFNHLATSLPVTIFDQAPNFHLPIKPFYPYFVLSMEIICHWLAVPHYLDEQQEEHPLHPLSPPCHPCPSSLFMCKLCMLCLLSE